MRGVAALIALVCAARLAHAGKVGVVTNGEPSLQPAVVKHFEKWLRNHGHDVVDNPMSIDAINTLSNCFTLDDLACARGVFDARAKTPTLVYVGIALNGTNITFNVYWFDKDKDAVGERRVCEKCEGNAWHGLTDKMLERLGGDTTKVVYVGGNEKHSSRLWPSLLMGAGIATLATGGIFFYYGSLGGADQKYIYPDSTPVGIALAAVGAGAAIGGTIWLVQSGTSRTGPVATATPGGAYLGWVGQF